MPRRSSRWGSKPHWTMLVGSKPAWVASLPFLSTVRILPTCADRVVVPVDLRAVGHRVLLAVLVRRVREAGLVEQALRVEQHRRVDRERDADLALVELVDVDRVLREARQVVVVLRDERREVQPLAVERVGAADADRPDDVRPVARGDLGREGVVGAGVRDRLEGQVDVRVAGVELLDDLLLDVDLLRRVATAEAAVPADLGLAGSGRRPVDGDRRVRRGRRGVARRRGDLGCRGRRGDGRRAQRGRGGRPAAAGADDQRQHGDGGGGSNRSHVLLLAVSGPPNLGGTPSGWSGGRERGAPRAVVRLVGSGAGAHDDALHVVAGPVAPDVGPGELDRPSRPVVREAFDAAAPAGARPRPAAGPRAAACAIGSSDSRARTTRVS